MKRPEGKPKTKKERFNEVAGRRVQKVLNDLDNLSKCANKNSYEYTEEETKKMVKAISDKLAVLKASFSANSKSGKQTFEF
ncbi:MAG: hypothetical protein J0H55_05180 [Chitinophagaceae bacterium]|nr:hypothetical protein [Chitinophagaceae bacterium]